VYDYLMTITLKKFLRRHERELHAVVDIPKALKATSIREFDEHVFMKMHGFADLESYWAQNNPMRAVENIQRPMLCINALDDPVCTKTTIRYDQFEDNPMAMLIETGNGSHCAFYEGNVFLKSWSNEAAIRYLDKLREFKQLDAAVNTDESVSITETGRAF
jgi:predicted alpha/beta-fold hydrolase